MFLTKLHELQMFGICLGCIQLIHPPIDSSHVFRFLPSHLLIQLTAADSEKVAQRPALLADWGFSYDRLPKNLRKHGKSCLRNETESPSDSDFRRNVNKNKNKNTTSLPAAAVCGKLFQGPLSWVMSVSRLGNQGHLKGQILNCQMLGEQTPLVIWMVHWEFM